MSMRGLLVLLPLVLMACSQEQEQEAEHHDHAGMTAAPPQDPASTPAPPAPVPVPAGTPIEAMPAAMHGRWGMTANDCDPARSDAKGLLVVGADSLGFYESRATLRKAAALGPDAVRATFAYRGEGMEWEAEDTFRLIQDGAVLVRRSTGAEPSEPFEYRRCA
jgi:hypothetical protein